MKGMQGHAREGGAASFLAVALMLVLTLLGLVCLLFARNSRLMAAEHLREIQLELAAEGVLDRVRCEVCRQPDFLRPEISSISMTKSETRPEDHW
ncbi:hypothetical protein [Mitsuokella jalaludinii]|uniref:hypothetical protein n=1 Tax=Mitsuokella jalaludinii TaxID=187979 RepID=UPI003F9AAA04